MRTYGIDQNTGNWTLLTDKAVTGVSNPVTLTINDVANSGSYITSTLYTALVDFVVGTQSVNDGDVLLNDQYYDVDGTLLYSFWTDITQNVLLQVPPNMTNISEQPGGIQSFFSNYGLSSGEVAVVDDSYIWLATLAQTLRLNTGESPIYSNYGIPAQQSVMTQIAPNSAVNAIQAKFAQYFASLSVVRNATATQPTYNINAVFLNGTQIQSVIAT